MTANDGWKNAPTLIANLGQKMLIVKYLGSRGELVKAGQEKIDIWGCSEQVSWESSIEFDHYLPVAKFGLSEEGQVRLSCYYLNMQPTSPAENQAKGAKIEGRHSASTSSMCGSSWSSTPSFLRRATHGWSKASSGWTSTSDRYCVKPRFDIHCKTKP